MDHVIPRVSAVAESNEGKRDANGEGALSRKELFRRLLTPFWLRPESALWYSYEAFLVRDYLLPYLKSPSLEIGTMDGVGTGRPLFNKVVVHNLGSDPNLQRIVDNLSHHVRIGA